MPLGVVRLLSGKSYAVKIRVSARPAGVGLHMHPRLRFYCRPAISPSSQPFQESRYVEQHPKFG
jgi:hypothetical protein